MSDPSTIIYLIFGIPGTLFVLIYSYEIFAGKIKTYPETWFLLTLATALSIIAMDIGIRHVFMGGQPGNPWVLRVSIGVAACAMWTQLILLMRRQVIPRWRRRRMQRDFKRQAADQL